MSGPMMPAQNGCAPDNAAEPDRTARRRLWDGLFRIDDLIECGADLTTVLTQAATVFGCTVGFRSASGDVSTASPDTPPVSPPVTAVRHTRSLRDGAQVWIGVPEGHLSLRLAAAHVGSVDTLRVPPAEVVLRRIGVAVTIVMLRERATGRGADVQTAVDADASADNRRAALVRLKMQHSPGITLIATIGCAAAIEHVVDQFRRLAPVVHHARVDGVDLIMTHGAAAVGQLHIPLGVRCAFTANEPPMAAPDTWRRTRNALRFALPSTHDCGPYPASESTVVDSAQLGGYAVLAEQLAPEQMAQVPDVQNLDALYRDSGPDMSRTLLAVASTDSLRQAARSVHMHHNSVAHRVERAEKILGFSCVEPYGRARLLLTLTLHRLLHSHSLF